VVADGRSRRERPFTREQLRTCAVWNGGDTPSGRNEPGGPGSGEPGVRDLLLKCCARMERLLWIVIVLLVLAILLLFWRGLG
jgi:hypothetical protein